MNIETPADSVETNAPPRRLDAAHVLTRGMSLGRYIVLEAVGNGGQGIVYAAYDPQLDRRVAIKLLHPEVHDGHGAPRLLNEARMLGRLSHPNVATVHDVGTFADHVFVAMAYLPGGTLSAWAKAAPRTPKEIVARFLEAGRGLAAAHAQGAIHRDFKPDNVLLDERGVAQVTDFGLAQLLSAAGSGGGGTPGYMSPEQLAHAPLGPAADQFAFCVSLFRVLEDGAAPFDATPEAIARGPAWPAASTTPAWLRRVVARGLALEPAQRWPSMDALLAALSDDPDERRRRTVRALAVAVPLLGVAVVAGALLFRESPKARAVRECIARVDAGADATWSGARVKAIEEAFVKAGGQPGRESFRRVTERLAPEVEAWRREATSACRLDDGAAHRVLTRCLDARGRVLQSLSQLFAEADATVVDNALNTVSLEVLPVASCHASAAVTVPALTDTDEDARLRPSLARARVLRAAGKYKEGIIEALNVADEAESAGARRVEAEANLLVGQLNAELGRADAEEPLKKAILLAEAAGADEERARGWMALITCYSDRRAWPQAIAASMQADAILQRLGRPDLLEAQRLNYVGKMLTGQEKYDEATESFAQALALRQKHLGEHHPDVTRSLNNYALSLGTSDERAARAEGVKLLEKVVRIRREVFGEQHPELAIAEYNLGNAMLDELRCEGALGHLQRALAIRLLQPAADPLRLGRTHVAIARANECLGKLDLAAAEQRVGYELLVEGNAGEDERRASLCHVLDLVDRLDRPENERKVVLAELRALNPDAAQDSLCQDVVAQPMKLPR